MRQYQNGPGSTWTLCSIPKYMTKAVCEEHKQVLNVMNVSQRDSCATSGYQGYEGDVLASMSAES